MAAVPRIKFCRCGSNTSPTPVDGGRLVCPDCGEAVPDPMLLLIARQQRQIIERLDRLERAPGDSAEDHEITAAGPELIDPAELARRLGVSRTFVYEHSSELGAVRFGEVGDGKRPRLFFRLEEARERLASLASANGSKPDKPKREPRRRRSTSGGAELLPIRDRAA